MVFNDDTKPRLERFGSLLTGATRPISVERRPTSKQRALKEEALWEPIASPA